jgi:asparagine synthase (glutamine-hydrolysing)
MCGICGKLLFVNEIPSTDLIRKMCKTIVHRGPDDEGVYTAEHIGLGQRRLTVIDLAPTACPPLSNENGTIWIVFNGEIYNFIELRKDLLNKGHKFKTLSDTETIIHLYEEEGIECLHRLRGMFAFALWDEPRGTLFCARDRLGKKPFCYTITPRAFIFGSEIKAITADPDVSVSPDYHAIDQYLTYQNVPSPLTAFEGIHRLRPGEFLTCDLERNVKIHSYWSPPAVDFIDASAQEIETEIIRRLRESVRMRMISDVPLGAFLSGGIDSGLIVALMAEESSRPVKTFSIGFEDELNNELPYARLQAERYGTEHHEMVIKPNAAELLSLLVYHYNEPFADSSALPTYCVSHMARQHVTVALSGDGGDESFAGYGIYSKILNWNRCNVIPLRLRKMVATVGKKIFNVFPWNNTFARLHRGFSMLEAGGVNERFLLEHSILKPEEKMLAYSTRFNSLLAESAAPEDFARSYPWSRNDEELSWMMRHNQAFYLPDCLMVKTDIASMANSLEVRCPFLDHEFIEFSAGIPSWLKHNGKSGKLILKSAAKKWLHPDIMTKPKTGFAIPLSRWFRNDLSDILKENLLDGISEHRGIIEQKLMRKMVTEHIEGRRDWGNRLWTFLFLELWFRKFID